MTTQPDLGKVQGELCRLAARIAFEEFGTRLDGSVDSVRNVEHILGQIHDLYCKTRLDNGLNVVALAFAAYIAGVIQTHFGPAQWERDCSLLGEETFPLIWGESRVYPYAWCLKRLFDGPDDNIWFKFQAIILEAERKKGEGEEPR